MDDLETRQLEVSRLGIEAERKMRSRMKSAKKSDSLMLDSLKRVALGPKSMRRPSQRKKEAHERKESALGEEGEESSSFAFSASSLSSRASPSWKRPSSEKVEERCQEGRVSSRKKKKRKKEERKQKRWRTKKDAMRASSTMSLLMM